jgi:hypothetical protein
MENGPFIEDFPIKTSIYKGFSMAMFRHQLPLLKVEHSGTAFLVSKSDVEFIKSTKWNIICQLPKQPKSATH